MLRRGLYSYNIGKRKMIEEEKKNQIERDPTERFFVELSRARQSRGPYGVIWQAQALLCLTENASAEEVERACNEAGLVGVPRDFLIRIGQQLRKSGDLKEDVEAICCLAF
jgi:hypothetical protein